MATDIRQLLPTTVRAALLAGSAPSALNPYITASALSSFGFVPYTGATANVDLGTFSLTTPNLIGGSAVGSGITYKGTTGNGTLSASAHTFVVGNNGATTAMQIFNSGQVSVGNYASPTNLRAFTVGQDTAWITMGSVTGITSTSGIWLNQAAPDSANYFVRNLSTSYTRVNAPSGGTLSFSVGDANYGTLGGGIWTFNPINLGTAGLIPFNITMSNTQGGSRPAGSNIPMVKVTGATSTWTAGALTTQYFNHFTANTLAFTSASTATDVYSLFVETSIVGTNATITNNWAIGTNGRVNVQGSSSDLINVGTNDGGFYNIKLAYNGVIGSTTGAGQLGNLGANALGFYLPTSATGMSRLVNTWTSAKISYEAYQHHFQFFSSANQTAEYSRFLVTGNQVNFTTAIATQRFNYFTAPTIVFNSANTVSESYSLYVEAATAGTNATITNNFALGLLAGTSTVKIGNLTGSSTTPAIYMNAATPSSTNYTISTTTTNTSVNAQGGLTSNLLLQVTGNTKLAINGSSTTAANFVFTTTAAATISASAELNSFVVNGKTDLWAAGTLATQRYNYFRSNTLSFAGASTATNVYTIFVEASIAGTNATITNNYALGISGGMEVASGNSLFRGVVTIARGIDANVTNFSVSSGTANIGVFSLNTDQPNSRVLLTARNSNTLNLGTQDTIRMSIDTSGNIICGVGAIATNATNGFLYVPSCAGIPTGTPTTVTGRIPIVADSTNNKLYIYSGGAWVALN